MILVQIVLMMTTLCQADNYKIINRAVLPVNKPAFQSLVPNKDPHVAPDLLVSSFGPMGSDHVYRISDMLNPFTKGSAKVDTFTDKISWPNEVRYIDSSYLGIEGTLISSGFLVPWKSTGAVSFVDMSGKVTQLTKNKGGYFYHRAIFADVTGTGRMDIITARAEISMLGSHDAELVWLKRPSHPLEEPWEEVVLTKGPDFHFRVFKDRNTQQFFVVSAEFSNKRIGLYWLEKDGSVGQRVIDDGIDVVFDLDFYDLNNDGVDELLATNHESDAAKSGVFAYEVPSDLKNGIWTRHTLLTGIQTRQPGFNQASPGAAKAFAPELSKAGKQKPWIIVSGDGSQRAHLLTPKSEARDNWDYNETIILDAKSTIGEPIFYDFNQDGLMDIVIPAYDADKLYIMSVIKN